MSQTGEIITLQVGNYANFVGAHFFNLQDPVSNPENESVFNLKSFWKEGENLQRQKVFTPRALIFDLKDNWTDGFIRSSGNHPDPQASQQVPYSVRTKGESRNRIEKVQETVSWDGKVQTVVLPNNQGSSESDEDSISGPRNSKKKVKKCQQEDFKHWGDFVKWKLHDTDKVTYRIPNFMYNSESGQLVSYGQGLDIYHKLEENVTDGIRLYAEDCDYLEGFHLLVDEYEGFSGIAAGVLEHIGDEFDKKACFGFGLNRPLPVGDGSLKETKKDYQIRISNTAHIWSSFNRHARVFTSFGICDDLFTLNPVAKQFTSVISDVNSSYISSSILAATLDSLTAPYRLNIPSFPLHEMTSLLNAFGHKMTIVGSSLPFPMNQQTLFKALGEGGLSSITSLAPNVNLDLEKSLGNIFVVRGIDNDNVISKTDFYEYKHASIKTINDCLELYCHESYSKSVHVIKNIQPAFKSSYPFPRLFEKNFLETQANSKQYNISQGDTWFLPAIASAHNSPAAGGILEKIVNITGGGLGGSATKLKTFYQPSILAGSGATIEFEDYTEAINDLDSLRESYIKS